VRLRAIIGCVVFVGALTGCATAGSVSDPPACAPLDGDGGRFADGAYGTEERAILILAAQAVPGATMLPCIDGYPAGWTFGGTRVANGLFAFWLNSDRAGLRAVEVVLTDGCDFADAVEVVPSDDEVGTRRFEQPLALPPNYAANRYYTFEGGCIEYRYRFRGTHDPALALEADQALGFRKRTELVDDLAPLGLRLCGAGAPPCAGEGP
jgi:hypothetical protein